MGMVTVGEVTERWVHSYRRINRAVNLSSHSGKELLLKSMLNIALWVAELDRAED